MTDEARGRFDPRIVASLALLAGLVAVVLAMAVGAAQELVAAVAAPPLIVRAGLAGFAIVLGGRLLTSAVRRIDVALRRPSSSPPRASRLPRAGSSASRCPS
jgi:hypothetical protein